MNPDAVSAAPSHRPRLLDDITRSLQQTAEEVAPWFLEKMPRFYFQDTDYATQLVHLRAIIAAQASGRPVELTLRSEDGLEWTSMRPLDRAGILAELVAELPHDKPLRTAKIHTAIDGTLVLDTFVFGEAPRADLNDAEQAIRLDAIIAYAAQKGGRYTPEELRSHFGRCSAEYVLTVTPLRFCNQYEIWREISGTDGTAVRLERESDPTQSRIIVAVGNATTRRMLERIATRLAHARINIHRAYLDVLDDSPNGTISLLGFVVQGPDGGPIDESGDAWKVVRRDLLRNKWIDHRALKLSYRNPSIDIPLAEVITGLLDLSHQILVKENGYAFNLDRIHRLAERNLEHSAAIARLFFAWFDPAAPMQQEAFDAACRELEQRIQTEVDLEDTRTILRKMLLAVRSTKRTNLYVENRYGLAMRIDPAFLATDERSELPFGVYFVHGRSFNGFHVRFRDIARGGLRAIMTRSEEQHALEAERLYDEAYNLAFAQQLKNKDIPEGGAKAAVLLDPYARLDRAVKGTVDCLLDLITQDEATQSKVLDRLGREELLYLGPDENVTPEFIVWICNRARRRGYKLGSALMSSKPGAGMNHKEFGVTSEGVNVFLEVGLRSIGIDPARQPFTIKMTGGPDGDVGGNLIRILARDYGANARIVGIADGSGSGEDPDGLDQQELLRLFHAGLPIGAFDRARLGPRGRVVSVTEPDGFQLRNSLHFRVTADAFVPCGGRPNTIHAGNWKEFLRPDGTPSSRLIVEGANIFLTADARNELSDSGVLIMKDSSANKCGVITSSYEIISNMLISEEEFLRVKPAFVADVLAKLRDFARREAQLLVRVHQHHPHVPLPLTSTRLSRVMIRTSDAIEAAMDGFSADRRALLRRLVLDHLPKTLIDLAGESIWTRLPEAYLRWLMAKSLAARIVYREGFEYLDAMPTQAVAELAVDYLAREIERESLAKKVIDSSIPERQRIADLLLASGILSTMGGRLTSTPATPAAPG